MDYLCYNMDLEGITIFHGSLITFLQRSNNFDRSSLVVEKFVRRKKYKYITERIVRC